MKAACECVLSRSVVSDSVAPWTVAHQASLPMAFSRREYWSRLPCRPDPGAVSPALTGGFSTTGATFLEGRVFRESALVRFHS